MEERIFFAFFHARRPADDDDGRFFGKSLGGRVGDLQTTDAISDTDCAKATDAGISIGGETRALLVACVNKLEFALRKLVVETKNVIAGNAEDVSHAVSVQALNEIFANGR